MDVQLLAGSGCRCFAGLSQVLTQLGPGGAGQPGEAGLACRSGFCGENSKRKGSKQQLDKEKTAERAGQVEGAAGGQDACSMHGFKIGHKRAGPQFWGDSAKRSKGGRQQHVVSERETSARSGWLVAGQSGWQLLSARALGAGGQMVARGMGSCGCC